MKKTFLYLTILALGLTACNLDIDQPVEAPEVETGAAVYQVRIPASMGPETKAVDFSGTDPETGKPAAVSSFTTTDKIYVYNQTKDDMLLGTLSPSAAGKTCDLIGTLIGTLSEDDNIVLLYNPSNANGQNSEFYYCGQDGATPPDYATATATVGAFADGVLTTKAGASFENLQSMFRFKFTDGTNDISVKRLNIASANNALAAQCYPLVPDSEDLYRCYCSIDATLATPTTDYVYVALCIKESGAADDVLTFTVKDADGNIYRGTKAAPSGGFKNGRYYYNAAAITLTKPDMPVLSRSDGGDEIELEVADVDNLFTVYGPDDSSPINFSVSGTSNGYNFYLVDYGQGSTVSLNSLTATFGDGPFIWSAGDLTLNLTGDNSLTCNCDYCIFSDGNLKLGGNGTLTVTGTVYDQGGLYATDNYDGISTDPSALAADGFTVTRSDMTDNGNGTYTWTYTVYPTNVDLSSVTTDGNDVRYYLAKDGQVLANSFSGQGYVIIPDGATVTLNDVSIQAPNSCDHAAIHCLGSANIIVCGSNMNSVTAGNSSIYPAIYVPHNASGTEYSLTISGTGMLYADGGQSNGGAGIGGGAGVPCGNIVLSVAYIYAEGSDYAAGIGSGTNGSCGSITISAGTVEVYGGEYAAGIGCGMDGSCGDITIGSGITSVEVNKGYNAYNNIGKSAEYSTCGTVSVAAGLYDSGEYSDPRTIT